MVNSHNPLPPARSGVGLLAGQIQIWGWGEAVVVDVGVNIAILIQLSLMGLYTLDFGGSPALTVLYPNSQSLLEPHGSDDIPYLFKSKIRVFSPFNTAGGNLGFEYRVG